MRTEVKAAQLMPWMTQLAMAEREPTEWIHDGWDGSGGCKWLHENRSEGCTTEAMDRAVQNGHLDVVKWRASLGHGRCSVPALQFAMDSLNLDLIKLLYDSDMAKLWPQPSDASQLAKLIVSHDKVCEEILQHIVTVRQQSCNRASPENPDEYAEVGNVVTSLGQDQSSLDLLTTVVEVSNSYEVAFEVMKCTAEFIFGERARSSDSADLEEREWVCELLNDTNESRRSMFFFMKKGELGLLRWLVCNCGADRVEEWLYSAVWVGRMDVVRWLWTQWSRMCDLRRSRAAAILNLSWRRTMFHSQGASFSTVRQRFENGVVKDFITNKRR